MNGSIIRTLTLCAAAIARSQPLRNMALALSSAGGDPAPYVNFAGSLATEQQLDYLEFLSQDGTIISSAQWPARFGMRLPWLDEVSDWNNQPAFLQYEETPQGAELALLSVRQLNATDRAYFVVAGRRIDSHFLSSLVLPEGTRVLLWQPSADAGELEDAQGKVSVPAELRAMLEESLHQRKDVRRNVHLDAPANGVYVAHAIPRTGRDSKQPLAILVVASSRQELADLQRRIRNIAFLVAAGGILLSVIASGWSAARISRPIEELSEAAQDVAAGNWARALCRPNCLRSRRAARARCGSRPCRNARRA